MKKKINEKMNISEILEICPKAGEVMAEQGMGCFGCMMIQVESLQDGAKAHGMSEEEIKKLVKKINQLIND